METLTNREIKMNIKVIKQIDDYAVCYMNYAGPNTYVVLTLHKNSEQAELMLSMLVDSPSRCRRLADLIIKG